jgi:hypothetical protein
MCRYPLKRNQILRVRVDPLTNCLVFILEEALGSRKIAKPYAFLTDPNCWQVFAVAIKTLQRGLKPYHYYRGYDLSSRPRVG